MISRAIYSYSVTIIWMILIHQRCGVFSQNSFDAITECVCPQDVITYECTVCGGLLTVWEGSLFECASGQIILTNSEFGIPGAAFGVCNNGAVVGRGLSIEDGCYTSQLNVTFDARLQGRVVRCSVDDGTLSSEVGRDILSMSTESFPPPRVQLDSVSLNKMNLSWSQSGNCPSLSYHIVSTNCGNCLSATNDTTVYVSCSDFTISNSITLCTFTVQSVICSNSGTSLIGSPSDSTIVNLTVPSISDVQSIPHYNIDGDLRSITVTFSNMQRSFYIYPGINGSVISYTVNYMYLTSGNICGSNIINATSCIGGVCSVEFNISSRTSLCVISTDITVTVFATTNLGEGPGTIPIKEEYQNNFVRVQVPQSTSISCTFLNVSKKVQKSCSAIIIHGEKCQDQSAEITGMSNNDNVVIINLRSFLEETISSEYCIFRVNATAGTRTVIVEGNLLSISSNNSSNSSAIIGGVVTLVIILIIIIVITIIVIAFIYLKGRRSQKNSDMPDMSMQYMYTDTSRFNQIILVTENCNMIDFAKRNIDNYDPDSGKGYYQFANRCEEYISPKTQIVLVSEDKEQTCTGPKAREIIGVSDKRELLTLPDLSHTPWTYVFIQSTSRIRTLLEGTHFMFYGKPAIDERLRAIDKKYYRLEPVREECTIPDFVKTIEGVTYNPKLGYEFYEFTKPEYILYDQQVILMDKDERLYYGPGARCEIIGCKPGQKTEAIEPNFDREQWKHAFIQAHSASGDRKLQPNTLFLYCNVASSELIKVLEPFEIFKVDSEAEDHERKLINFARENVPYYNPRASYAYYELTGHQYVRPFHRSIMAFNNNKELFTGWGVLELIGASDGFPEEIEAPDLSDTEWDCIFIQVKSGYGRLLKPNTRFLYCEYDYNPDVY